MYRESWHPPFVHQSTASHRFQLFGYRRKSLELYYRLAAGSGFGIAVTMNVGAERPSSRPPTARSRRPQRLLPCLAASVPCVSTLPDRCVSVEESLLFQPSPTALSASVA